jgi:CubicO group peptidase (beta-lactamase class C family)
VDDAKPTASATKSFVSALVGIALDKGFLTSLDQKIMHFFPELNWASMDPRKKNITIRHMLKMRSGYPSEQDYGLFEDFVSTPYKIPFLAEYPLTCDPGSGFGYSNLTPHILGIIVHRITGTPLKDFAQEYLFDSLGFLLSGWPIGLDEYYIGYGDVPMRSRDMAKFGSLYLNEGLYNGIRILPSEWIVESLQPYSFDVYGVEILDNMTNINYGYLWWSAISGDHSIDFAWGNGGQLIILLKEYNMIIVTTAYHLTFGEQGWQSHKLVLEMVGEFIASLP